MFLDNPFSLPHDLFIKFLEKNGDAYEVLSNVKISDHHTKGGPKKAEDFCEWYTRVEDRKGYGGGNTFEKTVFET